MIPCIIDKSRIPFANCGFIFIFSIAVFFFLGCGLVEQEENSVVIVVAFGPWVGEMIRTTPTCWDFATKGVVDILSCLRNARTLAGSHNRTNRRQRHLPALMGYAACTSV